MAKTGKLRKFSPAQSRRKTLYNVVSSRWSRIVTVSQRSGWNAYAASHPYVDVYGNTRYLSGHNWYCKCNVNLLGNGFPGIDNAPAGTPKPPTPDLSVTCDITGGPNYIVTTTYYPHPNGMEIMCFSSRSMSPGLYSYAHRFTFIGMTPVGIFGGTDVTNFLPDYLATMNGVDPKPTKKIAVLVQMMDIVTGVQSLGNGADCIIS